MVKSLRQLLVFLGFGSALILALLPLTNRTGFGWTTFLAAAILLTGAAAVAAVVFWFALERIEPFLDADAKAQALFLDACNARVADLAILLAAALSLFLELAVIRWQSSVLEFFAFYKNFTLLACFVGLGLGYALAKRDRIPLVAVIPLLTWEFGFMTVVRFGAGSPFNALPFREQLTMGVEVAGPTAAVALYALLTVVFLLTAAIFIPIGQLCGRLMERRSKLRAYGLNLLGSLLGVVLMLLASFLWTPPLVWFGLCFVALLIFHRRSAASLTVGIVSTAVCTIVLAWPVAPLRTRIFSPYQLLEIGSSPDTGLARISAAGQYYQRIYDFSSPRLPDRDAKIRAYYEFPFVAHPRVANVAIVGAGTGNDVAAALRSRAGHVEAIEIDPAILSIGMTYHPEKPYSNPRVRAVVDDARSFFRQTDQTFDVIVYGLLDSHTLLSQGSSVRLDSFVYTVEGLREARSRLSPDGLLSLSFSVLSDAMGRKIYLMLQQVFDGRSPICIRAGYDRAVIFLASNDEKWVLPRRPVEDPGFVEFAGYSNPALEADVSTDDWPFFYMPRRVYPVSYLIMLFQVLVLTVATTAMFVRETPRFSHLSFFFLGAGFMLVETKGITEMGLTFGNTWQVVGVVIVGILCMAFLGNLLVQRLNIKRSFLPYLGLWATLGLGWLAARSGGFASTPVGRLETAIVLTAPLFFSGIVFSTLLSGAGHVSAMMAMNLLGAICGGLLEYNSMYFGFRSLYVVAMTCYFLAFASEYLLIRDTTVAVAGTAKSSLRRPIG
jgi:hypothetical protein